MGTPAAPLTTVVPAALLSSDSDFVVSTLERARSILKEHGIAKGQFIDHLEQRCIVGAIEEAFSGYPGSPSKTVVPVLDALQASCPTEMTGRGWSVWGAPTSSWDFCAWVNNHADTTPDEIYRWIDATIAAESVPA